VTEGPFFKEHVASQYEAWYSTPDGRRVDKLEKAVLSWLLEQTAPGSHRRVLEVGCGTGHFTRWLSGESAMAVGLDLSPAMLAEAQALGAVALVCGDAQRLPFADGSFDITTAITTLEFVEHPRAVLAEADRVGQRGIVLGVLNQWSLLGIRRSLARLLRHTVYDTAHFYGVVGLTQMLRAVVRKKAHIVWRTTLFPRLCPWSQAWLPCGGFIGIALIEGGRFKGRQ